MSLAMRESNAMGYANEACESVADPRDATRDARRRTAPEAGHCMGDRGQCE